MACGSSLSKIPKAGSSLLRSACRKRRMQTKSRNPGIAAFSLFSWKLAPWSTMTTAVSTTAAATAASWPATASSTAASTRTTTAAAPRTTIPIRRTFASTTGRCTHRIPVEVRLIVVELRAPFDGQRGRRCRGAPFFDAFRQRLAAHLRTLLFQDGLARKPYAVALDCQHLHQHPVAFLEFVLDVLNAMLSHFADVQQA